MTELELRKLVVSTFQKYNGAHMGDLKHRDIVDTYNSITSLSTVYKPLVYIPDTIKSYSTNC